jgi:DNA-binding transcriptional MerR regulator
MLTKREAAARLNIHETTLAKWAENGLVTRHPYNAHYYLYEVRAGSGNLDRTISGISA